MRAARCYGKKDIRLEDVPVPEVGPSECLVEVEWCGVCGSDLHEYLHGSLVASIGVEGSVVMGHEFCGRIKVAPEGSKLRVGQAVMVDPHYYCGKCPDCVSGNDHLCGQLAFLGLGVKGGGGLSEFVAVEESHCYPLPNEVSLEFAAVIEPLVVCYHAMKASGMALRGKDVLVVGGGPIGIAMVSMLRTQGVKSILLSEPTAKRMQQAKGLVDRIIDPRKEKVGDACRDLTNGRGVDVAFDCAGVQPGLEAALDALKPAGVFIGVAIWDTPISIPFMQFFLKEIKFSSSCCYNANDFRETMELVANGMLRMISPTSYMSTLLNDSTKGQVKNYEQMVTTRIALEDTVRGGFEELINNKDNHVKILISPKRTSNE
ncbi:chlorophyll synthesis pathway protein BchC [Phialophora macrospora]|uniref:Chlorophyll synthesis pathway protein BchC n=1 Tax=Phialophora macrospora TaxID=1851006 RepID=A0A0D2FE84_9EURO|nr:chlorophyll synthesis pathway protein BchC [Phialophora macrospora]